MAATEIRKTDTLDEYLDESIGVDLLRKVTEFTNSRNESLNQDKSVKTLIEEYKNSIGL